jgi:hypothetical protein
MAALPDRVVVVGFQDDKNVVASIEIKTRVAVERIQHAEEIAAKYHHKLIVCDIGDDTWKECIEEEHSTQVLLQLWGAAVIQLARLPTFDVIAMSLVYYSRDIGVKSLALFLLSSNLLVRLRP